MTTQIIPKHPLQPLELVDGIPRFKANAIVCKLLDEGPFTMNDLCIGFSDEDKTQFAQLIGYSLSGFSELSYVNKDTYEAVATMYQNDSMSEPEARLLAMENTLNEVRDHMKPIVEELFGIAVD